MNRVVPAGRGDLADDEPADGPVADAERAEPTDLRLALGAGTAWLGVLWAADRSSVTCMWAAVLATVLGGLGLMSVRGGRRLAAPALALFCLALVLWPLAGRIAHARDAPLGVLAQRHAAVDAELTVTADPRVLAAKGLAGMSRAAVEASADAVVYGGRRYVTDGVVLVLGDAGVWTDVLPGQRVRVSGSLQPALDPGSLSVTLFTRDPPGLLGHPPWWQRLAGSVRASLRRASSGLPAAERGLLPGLVDGDTANLDPVLAERFRLAGLTHLVAVSGTNCSILIGAVLLVLRRLRVRPRACAVVGALVLALFVVVARPSPSVLRAALMGAVALAALATGRPRSAVPVLSAVTIGLLLWDPTLAASASFAMSRARHGRPAGHRSRVGRVLAPPARAGRAGRIDRGGGRRSPGHGAGGRRPVRSDQPGGGAGQRPGRAGRRRHHGRRVRRGRRGPRLAARRIDAGVDRGLAVPLAGRGGGPLRRPARRRGALARGCGRRAPAAARHRGRLGPVRASRAAAHGGGRPGHGPGGAHPGALGDVRVARSGLGFRRVRHRPG